MYGIGNRPAFINHQYGTKGTKANSGTFNTQQPKRYYSSLDAEIYFSDYYVDEIVHIQYSVAQNAIPLFGYNSYVYDEVAIGNRIIQGTFAINFTSPGYLFDLLDKIQQDENVYQNNQGIPKTLEGTQDETSIEDEAIILKQSQRPIWNTTFDIDVMFGEENSRSSPTHSVLEGVVILNSSLQLDTSGTPIGETYTFLARDIRIVE